MATIGSLVVTVAADAEPFKRGLKQAKTEHQLFTEHILKNKKFKEEMGPDAGFMGMMGIGGPAAIGVAVAGVSKLIDVMKEAANTFEETSNSAQQFGISFNDMRGLEILGDSLKGELIVGMSKFQKLLGEAAHGSKEAQKSFEDLGMDWKKLSEMQPGEAFGEAIDLIAGMDNQLAKANASTELFGKNGAALLPILNKGREGIAEARKLAGALNLSDIDQSRLSKIDQMFDDMGNTMKAAKEHAAAFMGGGLQQFVAFAINPKLGAKMFAEAHAASQAAQEMKKYNAAQAEVAMKAKEVAVAVEKVIEKLQEQADFAGMNQQQKEIAKLERQGANPEQLQQLRQAAADARDAEEREKLLDDANEMNNKFNEQAAVMGAVGRQADILKLKLRGLNEQWVETLEDKAHLLDLQDFFTKLDDQLAEFGLKAGDKMLQRLMDIGATADQMEAADAAIQAMERAKTFQDMKASPGTFSAQILGSSEELASRNRLLQGLQFKDAKERLQEEANKILEEQRKELAKILKELQGEQKPKVVQM